MHHLNHIGIQGSPVVKMLRDRFDWRSFHLTVNDEHEDSVLYTQNWDKGICTRPVRAPGDRNSTHRFTWRTSASNVLAANVRRASVRAANVQPANVRAANVRPTNVRDTNVPTRREYSWKQRHVRRNERYYVRDRHSDRYARCTSREEYDDEWPRLPTSDWEYNNQYNNHNGEYPSHYQSLGRSTKTIRSRYCAEPNHREDKFNWIRQ